MGDDNKEAGTVVTVVRK